MIINIKKWSDYLMIFDGNKLILVDGRALGSYDDRELILSKLNVVIDYMQGKAVNGRIVRCQRRNYSI